MAKPSRARAPGRRSSTPRKPRAKGVRKKLRKTGKLKRTSAQESGMKQKRSIKTAGLSVETTELGTETFVKRRLVWPKIYLTPQLLADCRCRYETTAESVTSIALVCGVSRAKVYRLAHEHLWTRFRPEPLDVATATRLRERATTLAEAARGSGGQSAAEVTSTLTFPLSEGGSAEAIAAAVAAVLAGVQEELATVRAMRARMKDEPQTALDTQRAAQTYASLNATLKDLQRAQCTAQSNQYASGHYDDDMPADIDEFRNELARRIDAFVAGRTKPRDASGDAVPPVAEV